MEFFCQKFSEKFKNILDFVCWGDNPSNKTPDIEIPDYQSTLMSREVGSKYLTIMFDRERT
jgi:hypothetical protein